MKLFHRQKDHRKDNSGHNVKRSLSLESLLNDLANRGISAYGDMNGLQRRLIWKWASNVIHEYRKILDEDPRNLRSVQELPFTKQDVKMAIKLSLLPCVSEGLHSLTRNLKNIYKELGTFQEYVKQASNEMDQGDQKQTSSGLAKDIRSKYLEVIVSEKKSLLEEINHYVEDLKGII